MSGGGGAWMTGLNDRMTNSTNSSSGWCMSVIGGGGEGGGVRKCEQELFC